MIENPTETQEDSWKNSEWNDTQTKRMWTENSVHVLTITVEAVLVEFYCVVQMKSTESCVSHVKIASVHLFDFVILLIVYSDNWKDVCMLEIEIRQDSILYQKSNNRRDTWIVQANWMRAVKILFESAMEKMN